MFRILIAVIAIFATMAFGMRHEDGFYEAKFVDYLKEHRLRARDGAHFVHMLKNFRDNHDFIEDHNESGSSFTMAINHFAHLSEEEWVNQMRLGLGVPHRDAGDFIHSAANATAVPDSIDWTTKGAVTPVKDQGQCGSCWSFSTTGALEGAYHIKNKNLESFSEQNLVDCDQYDAGCNGGLMDNAFKWTKENGGLCTEADYPYTSGTSQKAGTCDTSCKKNTGVAPKSYTDVPKNSDKDFMSALAQQPLAVAIQANQRSFQFYSGGVMDGRCGTRLDHGVLAVGYGTLNGQDYYKVKNSWGPTWGDNGYILLARGGDIQRQGQCGILMDASYPTL